MGLSFTIAVDFASAVILGSESRGTYDHILLSQIRDSTNLRGQDGPVIVPGTAFPFHRLLRLAGSQGHRKISVRIENKTPLPLLLYSLVAVEACLFAKPLLSNGCYIAAYFAVVAQQRVYMLHTTYMRN
jgi:hypothetical protein